MVLETREIGGADPEEEKETTDRKKPDLKPEHCHYRDEGCEYAKSCLECPFPRCIYDEPRSRQRWRKRARDRQIRKLYENGMKVKKLAVLFGVSQRTIRRALESR
jgi:hypothetical protein